MAQASYSQSELDLLQATDSGSSIQITSPRDNPIRGDVLSSLIRGELDQHDPTHRGIDLSGALIIGGIDLSATQIKFPLRLRGCEVRGLIDIRDSNLLSLDLEGSIIAGLQGELAEIRGVMTMSKGFSSTGRVTLSGATVGGALYCAGGRFEQALEIYRAKLQGDCFLGETDADEGECPEFCAADGVYLNGSTIGGSVYCRGGSFAVRGTGNNRKDIALSFANVTIGDTLSMKGLKALAGVIDLSGATMDKLCDAVEEDVLSPSQASRETLPASPPYLAQYRRGNVRRNCLILDGCVFRRLFSCESDLRTRQRILESQVVEDLGANFKPQPWEQMIHVLREMGYESTASALAIEKQECLRRAGKVRWPHIHALFGQFTGYGYKPSRALVWLGAALLTSALLYETGYRYGVIVPAKTVLQTHAANIKCDPGATDIKPGCYVRPLPSATFSALMYSADYLFPFIDFQQRKEWSPAVIVATDRVAGAGGTVTYANTEESRFGMCLRILTWIETIVGWIATGVLAAIVGGLIKRD
jgi:hypothetical protein